MQLHALIRLGALETGADGLHQAVNESLARRPAVQGVTRDVSIRSQLLGTTDESNQHGRSVRNSGSEKGKTEL